MWLVGYIVSDYALSCESGRLLARNVQCIHIDLQTYIHIKLRTARPKKKSSELSSVFQRRGTVVPLALMPGKMFGSFSFYYLLMSGARLEG